MVEKKKENETGPGWDIQKMQVESKKVEETKPVIVPVSEDATVKDLSSDDIARVITKKKHRFFDRSKKPEDYTVEELEIIKAQKIEEERLQKEKDADEATLAMMRAEKKGYYESYRKSFLMQQPFEVRLNLFFKFYTVNFKSNGLETDKKKMESVQVWQDLFGVKMIDKKHVFTDQEFETFFARCKDVGVYCPYDLFIKHALEHHVPNRENAVADKHRHDLYNQA